MSTRVRSGLAALLAAAASAACGLGGVASPGPGTASADFVFPTHAASMDGPAAQLRGTVEVQQGCIYVHASSGSRYLVVWPASMTLRVDARGQPVVEQNGDHVAAPGEIVELNGGETANPVSPRCPGNAWLVTGLAGAAHG